METEENPRELCLGCCTQGWEGEKGGNNFFLFFFFSSESVVELEQRDGHASFLPDLESAESG